MKKTLTFILVLLGVMAQAQVKFGGSSISAARTTLKGNSNAYTLTYVDGVLQLVSTSTNFPIAMGTATQTVVPLLIGGSGTTSTLTYRTTTGVGATGSDHIFQVGNNGATEAMRILNSGNVGIGTSSPAFKLDVSGDIQSYSASGGGAYYSSITDANSNARNWVMRGNSVVYGDFDIRQSGAVGGNPVSSGVSRFYITSTGNVGIGTISPTSKLYVVGDIQKDDTNGYLGFANRVADGNNYGLYYDSSSGMLQIYTNSNARLNVTSAGNVGIGTTSPDSKLHVSSGNIETDNSANGLILKSPDGTRYLIKVANGGSLTATAL